jgi:hypothetical protein
LRGLQLRNNQRKLVLFNIKPCARFIGQVRLTDATGAIYVSVFDDIASVLFGNFNHFNSRNVGQSG